MSHPNSLSNALPAELTQAVPVGNFEGFKKYLRYDLIAGFLVFLIALPLCLAISIASGYPPVAGVFTAIVGAVLTTFISNAELTIKGPAAGLIVIAIGTVQAFGYTYGGDPEVNFQAYRMALAVGVAAGVIQILFGLLRAGVLGDFFPTSVVHGMLSAIGVIIILKQLPVTVGQSAKGEPLEILRELPHLLGNPNPQIAVIGIVSLLILFGKPWIKNRWVKMVPSQLIVLLVAVPMGYYFDLDENHVYSFLDQSYEVGPKKNLVDVPGNLFNAIATPNFNALLQPVAWWWIAMYALIGSLESMLSAKAVDMVDPWKRKTNLNRDLVGVGIANTVAAMIGGLPMISEIVRSKANIDSGARTRFADFWHGIFLLAFVALLPFVIHRIPLAALAAMLVYTGFRLASPREFINVFHTGTEQLIVFVSTIVGVLATDLLWGIFIGVGVKLLIHTYNGVPLNSLFKAYLEVEDAGENTSIIRASQSAVFSNWIPFQREINQLGRVQRRNVIIDLSNTKLVDHSTMEKLNHLREDFLNEGLSLQIVGLESHVQLSGHAHAARRQGTFRSRRITLLVEPEFVQEALAQLIELGATGYTLTNCAGVGRRGILDPLPHRTRPQTRIEVIVAELTAHRISEHVRLHILSTQRATFTIETVEVLRNDQY
jgi:MFS superfamily sulfate permease-like transporter